MIAPVAHAATAGGAIYICNLACRARACNKELKSPPPAGRAQFGTSARSKIATPILARLASGRAERFPSGRRAAITQQASWPGQFSPGPGKPGSGSARIAGGAFFGRPGRSVGARARKPSGRLASRETGRTRAPVSGRAAENELTSRLVAECPLEYIWRLSVGAAGKHAEPAGRPATRRRSHRFRRIERAKAG